MICECRVVSAELDAFWETGRVVLRCASCGKLWPDYTIWFHRRDSVLSQATAPAAFFREWGPWLIPAFVLALAAFVLFIEA